MIAWQNDIWLDGYEGERNHNWTKNLPRYCRILNEEKKEELGWSSPFFWSLLWAKIECSDKRYWQLFFRIMSLVNLRTVPSFVSAHTFCASRKAWFKCHARAGLTLTQSTTLLKWLKWIFLLWPNSSLVYLYLNQEHQNSSISLTTNC